MPASRARVARTRLASFFLESRTLRPLRMSARSRGDILIAWPAAWDLSLWLRSTRSAAEATKVSALASCAPGRRSAMTVAASWRACRARSDAVSASSVSKLRTAPSVSMRSRPPAAGTNSGPEDLLVVAGAALLVVAPGFAGSALDHFEHGRRTGMPFALAEPDVPDTMVPTARGGGGGVPPALGPPPRRRAKGLRERPLGSGSGAMGRAGNC